VNFARAWGANKNSRRKQINREDNRERRPACPALAHPLVKQRIGLTGAEVGGEQRKSVPHAPQRAALNINMPEPGAVL
jgi:hypothetical protein